MVRYLFNENVNYAQSNNSNSKLESGTSGEIKSQSLFWNQKAKKPTKLTFLILISFTLIFLIWGIVDLLSSTHEIKVEIDYSDDYSGYVEFYGTTEFIDEDMGNEYIYEIREGNEISVYIRKSSHSFETLTVKIYDNDELVKEEYIIEDYGSIYFEYTVEE